MPKSLAIDDSSEGNIGYEIFCQEGSGWLHYPHILKKVKAFRKENPGSRLSDIDVLRKVFSGTEEERIGNIYAQNMAQYGAKTWYDWCVKHWGTKWNSYSFSMGDDNSIMFDTAWSAPQPIFKALAERLPECRIVAGSHDEGDNFASLFLMEGGECKEVDIDPGNRVFYQVIHGVPMTAFDEEGDEMDVSPAPDSSLEEYARLLFG